MSGGKLPGLGLSRLDVWHLPDSIKSSCRPARISLALGKDFAKTLPHKIGDFTHDFGEFLPFAREKFFFEFGMEAPFGGHGLALPFDTDIQYFCLHRFRH